MTDDKIAVKFPKLFDTNRQLKPENIFNCDESGLPYEMALGTTIVFGSPKGSNLQNVGSTFYLGLVWLKSIGCHV